MSDHHDTHSSCHEDTAHLAHKDTADGTSGSTFNVDAIVMQAHIRHPRYIVLTEVTNDVTR